MGSTVNNTRDKTGGHESKDRGGAEVRGALVEQWKDGDLVGGGGRASGLHADPAFPGWRKENICPITAP